MATFRVHCEVAGKVVRIEARAGARVAAGDPVDEGWSAARPSSAT